MPKLRAQNVKPCHLLRSTNQCITLGFMRGHETMRRPSTFVHNKVLMLWKTFPCSKVKPEMSLLTLLTPVHDKEIIFDNFDKKMAYFTNLK